MTRSYGKMRSSFDSEGTSTGLSPPPSPPRLPLPVYFVQSPSRESHDGTDKPSFHSTPVMSPMASPMHPHQSFLKHSGSLQSEASSVPPAPKPGSRRVLPHGGGGSANRHRQKKGGYKQWIPGTILEEEEQQGIDSKQSTSVCCKVLRTAVVSILVLIFLALIYWLITRPHSPSLAVKKITFNEFTVVQGAEDGVPTRILTSNCTVMLTFKNPSKYFGLHAHATDISLIFGDLQIAKGTVRKFYQRKSTTRTFPINVEAIKVPLYGAGPELEEITTGGGNVPLQIGGAVSSRANVFGKLKPSKFTNYFTCKFSVVTSQVKFLDVLQNKCIYQQPK